MGKPALNPEHSHVYSHGIQRKSIEQQDMLCYCTNMENMKYAICSLIHDGSLLSIQVTDETRVCSKHFVRSDYVTAPHTSRKRLNAEAVPSVFAWAPSPKRCRMPAERDPLWDARYSETESRWSSKSQLKCVLFYLSVCTKTSTVPPALLTPRGLVMPYGDIDLGQHWFM